MSGKQLNRLTLDLMLRLTDYVRANYAQSQMSETEFADQASKALGFPVVMSNVNTARVAVGLPANAKVKSAALKVEREAKKMVEPSWAGAQVYNRIMDEMHALNRALANLNAKMDRLLQAANLH